MPVFKIPAGVTDHTEEMSRCEATLDEMCLGVFGVAVKLSDVL